MMEPLLKIEGLSKRYPVFASTGSASPLLPDASWA